jgi:flagellar basal-body rod modification protein FlgD
MDITTSTAVGAAALTGSASQATPVISSDFETFIKMLTAQARYQDPLEPIDSSEYAAQLAQFSMVEQQVLSNELLTSLASQLGAGNMAQLANWIGMEARTTAPVQFDGSPIQITPNPAAVSDQVFLIVRNGSGQEVQRIQIPVSSDPIEWAGVANDGGPFENGRYSFDIESRANGEVILSEPSQTYSRIVETRLEGTQTVLVLEGGSAISTNDVSGLREPSSGL